MGSAGFPGYFGSARCPDDTLWFLGCDSYQWGRKQGAALEDLHELLVGCMCKQWLFRWFISLCGYYGLLCASLTARQPVVGLFWVFVLEHLQRLEELPTIHLSHCVPDFNCKVDRPWPNIGQLKFPPPSYTALHPMCHQFAPWLGKAYHPCRHLTQHVSFSCWRLHFFPW